MIYNIAHNGLIPHTDIEGKLHFYENLAYSLKIQMSDKE